MQPTPPPPIFRRMGTGKIYDKDSSSQSLTLYDSPQSLLVYVVSFYLETLPYLNRSLKK